MNNLVREQNRFPAHIAGSMTRHAVGDNKPSLTREPASVYAEKYDALDYRLMATFPASDATAQY